MLTKFWEQQSLIKALYADCVDPVCQNHQMTRMALDVLLFLANNPSFDTAADMVNIRQLTKSHVSMAISQLSHRGFLSKHYENGNRKTVHLKITGNADAVLQDGKMAQKKFISILFADFSQSEQQEYLQLFLKVQKNIQEYFKEEDSHD